MQSLGLRMCLGATVASLMLASSASAMTITFDGLTGSHVPFTTYNESGFTATVTSGIWGQGQFEGNPVPSIFTGAGAFGGPALNTIGITQGGNTFAFDGLDLAPNFSSANYEFVGTLKGSTVFDVMGTQSDLTEASIFQTIGVGNSIQAIDTLSIAVNDPTETANIDNIVVQPLPVTPQNATIAFNGRRPSHNMQRLIWLTGQAAQA